MNNAKIQFSKTFTRVLKIEGEVFRICQSQDGYLSVFDQMEKIYHYDATANEVIYNDTDFSRIKRVLHQAHIDRYPVKSSHA
jgi:hypothetical protein